MPGIGKRIRQKREELGITQEELAKRLGYKNKSTIAKIENETNDIVQSKVIEFATALNTSIAYLMGWDNKKSDEGSHAKARMIMDNQFVELFSYWEQLSDKGKEKLMDNASDLCQIYRK